MLCTVQVLDKLAHAAGPRVAQGRASQAVPSGCCECCPWLKADNWSDAAGGHAPGLPSEPRQGTTLVLQHVGHIYGSQSWSCAWRFADHF